MGRLRANQKSVSRIPGPHFRRLIQYLLSTYFVSASALEAGDSELREAISLPSEKLQFRKREDIVNATGNAIKGRK